MPSIPTTLYSVPGTYTSKAYGNGKLTASGSVLRVAYNGSVQRTSVNTPGYGLKKMTGKLPENLFSFTQYDNTQWQGFSYNKSRQGGNVYETYFIGAIGGNINYSQLSGSADINVRNEVISKVLAKVKDSDVDFSVMAGEAKETIQMFRQFAHALRNSANLLRRGDAAGLSRYFGLGPKALKDTAGNAWLMWSYGISPLVSDLYGSCKALEKGLIKESYCVARDRVTHEESDGYDIKGPAGTDKVTVISRHVKVEGSIRLKYTVTEPYLATLSSLGLTNPLSTAWELVRLSFVLDWAIGIGDWLSSLDSFFGKKFKDGSITIFRKSSVSANESQSKAPGYDIAIKNWYASYSYTTVSRQALGFAPKPIPFIKSRFVWQQVASASALLNQMRKAL